MTALIQPYEKPATLKERAISLSRGKQFWLFQAGGWTVWGILLVVRDLTFVPAEYLLGRGVIYLLSALVGILLTTLLRGLYRMVWDNGVLIRITTVLLGSLSVALVWQPISNYMDYMSFGEFLPFEDFLVEDLLRGSFSIAYPTILMWSGLYFFIKYYQLFQLEKEKSLRSEALAQEAQLRMLRYQLNPHFLFNTLNAISTLVLDKSTDQANQMLTKLSKFLRYSLDHSPLDRVTFAHELETSKLYLDIEKVRFGERMQIEISVEDTAMGALVPSMLLQPLIENSIKHGLSKMVEGGKITITAQVDGDRLILTVADNGPGIPESLLGESLSGFTGVGLMNVRNRLKEMYGANQRFAFTREQPSGCKATVVIPFEVTGN
ncbi:MAG: histidine kinase [Gammaproteobacteria bacterium]|nr:histidine kinase [Pseudomonadales bacterium]MCP5346661.1 histidine kinase [Pseudomonadales bacterium]